MGHSPRPEPSGKEACVTFTAVVPVHNSSRTLSSCLEALRISGGNDLEIVVVDDGSKDDSVNAAKPFADKTVQFQDSYGPAKARNAGARLASGDIVVFVDADVLVPDHAFELLRTRFEADDCLTAVQGVYALMCPHENAASQYKNLYYHYSWMKRIRNPYLASAASFFFAIRKTAFVKMSGFDEDIRQPTVEDADLGFRLHVRGHRVLLERDLQIVHDRRYHVQELVNYDRRLASAKTRFMLRKAFYRSKGSEVHPTTGWAVSTARASEMKSWLLTLVSIPLAFVFLLTGWLWGAVFAVGIGCATQIPFFAFVKRQKGFRLACAFVGITLLDVIAIDVGIVWGTLSFAVGKRY
jgi:glycosyltransferase involved in cell wall biosynthesis